MVERNAVGDDIDLLCFQARYFSGVFCDIVCDWIEEGMPRPVPELSGEVISMVPENLMRALTPA